MSNIDKQALTAESARESGNILLIVAARMARRELFTPLHYVSELPQKVVSMRVFREALERSEETLQREVCKIVDGHDRMQKKLKEAEEKLEAAEKRIAELEAREVNGRFPLPKDSSQGWKIDPEFIGKIQDAIGYDEECQCWEGSPSMEMVEAVLIAAAAIKMDERG